MTDLDGRYDTAQILDVAAHLDVRGPPSTAKALEEVANSIVAYISLWEELGGPFEQRPPDDVRLPLYNARDRVRAAREELCQSVRTALGHA